ncbi:aspartate/glutamate racemase family protein [Pectobacterium sp. B1J-3]|uniref:aspartate/glutamate racemase family protein n=1 Tax=Pectobacterium sp. B1J-3 TaxID=3385371 RepID=UPI003905E346
MKKLGLIGGIGPESTLLYYRKLVYEVHRRVGGSFFPNLTIESLNVFDVLTMCQNKDYDALVSYLMVGIKNLVAAGAEVVALTGNTPHIVFDELQEQATVPLISIIESTCDEARRLNKTKVGLLGTRFTMESDFFKKAFRDKSIAVVVPTQNEIDFVAQTIAEELEHGIVKEETYARFSNIVERMKREQCIDAVVLGCTELPLLFGQRQQSVDCLDTMEIHINALIAVMLGNHVP